MNGRQGGADGPEDVDAAFAEIIAGLELDGFGTNVTELDRPEPPGQETTSSPAGSPASSTPTPPTGWRIADAEWDWDSVAGSPSTPAARDKADDKDDPDEHYVPPEPPPLPRPKAATIAALLLFVAGAVLLVAPSLFGLSDRVGTPLALIALASAVGWLVLHMRQGPPPDSGWDDGAQV